MSREISGCDLTTVLCTGEGLPYGGKVCKALVILVMAILMVSVSIFLIHEVMVWRINRSVLARAATAEKDGSFEEAIRLYQGYLETAPDDQDAQLKYADVLLKGPKNAGHQDLAAQIFGRILGLDSKRPDIRRRLADLGIERGHYTQARLDLGILLKSEPKDGELHFMLGRCLEELGDLTRAEASYQAAIANGAPQWLEAYQRRAEILRSQLGRPEEADRLIEEMVKSAPDDPRVFLVRARYRRSFAKTPDEIKAITDDLQQVLKHSAKEPDVYLELAALGNAQESRQILEEGLKAVPGAPSLHEALAMIELRSGSVDSAIARLHQSLEILPNEASLHWTLANILADKGDTTDLPTQIDDLRRLNWSPFLIDFLEASLQVNSKGLAEGPPDSDQASGLSGSGTGVRERSRSCDQIEISAQRPSGPVL